MSNKDLFVGRRRKATCVRRANSERASERGGAGEGYRPGRTASCRFPYASPVLPSGTGKQETAPEDRSKPLTSSRKFGAGEGIRTLDPNLGKVVIYDRRAGYRSLSRQEATSRVELRYSALHFSVNCAGRLGICQARSNWA
jgi:hypothetical protein